MRRLVSPWPSVAVAVFRDLDKIFLAGMLVSVKAVVAAGNWFVACTWL
jgi:hypothetical protein